MKRFSRNSCPPFSSQFRGFGDECAGACKDCSGARFSWRCAARLERAPQDYAHSLAKAVRSWPGIAESYPLGALRTGVN
jgi:hypothetical protein